MTVHEEALKAAPHSMPAVDQQAMTRAAVAARQARAELKRRLRSGEVSPLQVLSDSRAGNSAAATLRMPDFLLTFPGIGNTKMPKILDQLRISPRKRLGGLGRHQRERLERFVCDRIGVEHSATAPPLTVLAGPSAVGKGTVAAYIRQHFPQIRHSVSVTTRPARPGEVHGVHYFFISDEAFDRMLAHGELLEWATVHNRYRYGTPREPIRNAAARGERMLLEIDLQGARQVRANDPAAQLIFLAPPSWEALVERLIGRGTENEQERRRRLDTARRELAAADEFDAVIINDEVSQAASELVARIFANAS